MIALLLNHLWQSSLCIGGAGLLALALHRNGANVRFWLWFAASVKFLVPFALLTALSAAFLTPVVPQVHLPAMAVVEPLAQPFAPPSMAVAVMQPSRVSVQISAPAILLTSPAPAAHLNLDSVALAVWIAGFLMIAFRWLVRWSRVRALLRDAETVDVDAPIAVKFSSSRLEPGLVGILRPIILLPRGIERQLSAAELKAVLAHELCHWRRRDNLLAAIHMLVEALFWFFPLVWWLGARLNAERERACDESVLAAGNDPELYAEGILKVCRAYLQSPLACVAGVSGAGLKQRIDTIMENRVIPQLNAARKFVLGTSAAATLAVPLLLGLATVPVAPILAKAAVSFLPGAKAAQSQPPAENQADPYQVQAVAIRVPHLPLPQDAAAIALASNDPLPADAPNTVPATAPQPAAAQQIAAATPASAAADDAPRPQTEAGIRCLLALGEDGCWRLFEIPRPRRVLNCISENWSELCPSGRLESIEYLGTNAAGGDVYSVSFMHEKDTYVLRRPGPDGKTASCIFRGPPEEWSIRRNPCVSLGNMTAEITAPANPPRILYTRASAQKVAAPANPPRPKTEAGLRCLLGMGTGGCWNLFKYPPTLQRITDCTSEGWGNESEGACPWGRLESIEYLGTNAAGGDVYSVSFMHQKNTYILRRPGPDGKIATRCMFAGPVENLMRPPCQDQYLGNMSAEVTSPANPPQILYTRAAQDGARASASASGPASASVTVPNTPSGAGDPNAVVCRAPQRMAGTDQFGPPLCLHNAEWWKVAVNGKDIAPDGKTFFDRPTVKNPTGEGDPDTMTCRTPQYVSHGPLIPVCRLNSFWADVLKNHQAVDARGNVVSRDNSGPGGMQGAGFDFVHNDGYQPADPNVRR